MSSHTAHSTLIYIESHVLKYRSFILSISAGPPSLSCAWQFSGSHSGPQPHSN